MVVEAAVRPALLPYRALETVHSWFKRCIKEHVRQRYGDKAEARTEAASRAGGRPREGDVKLDVLVYPPADQQYIGMELDRDQHMACGIAADISKLRQFYRRLLAGYEGTFTVVRLNPDPYRAGDGRTVGEGRYPVEQRMQDALQLLDSAADEVRRQPDRLRVYYVGYSQYRLQDYCESERSAQLRVLERDRRLVMEVDVVAAEGGSGDSEEEGASESGPME